MLDDIALSLTNKLRALNTTTWIQGTAREPATFVHVNWYWLVFPAALVALSIIFLAMTIIFSRETEGALWKTSLLPFLFYDLRIGDQRGEGVQLRDMERVADGSFAMLQQYEGEGMKFSSNDSPRRHSNG
jgi:hypothetical protein